MKVNKKKEIRDDNKTVTRFWYEANEDFLFHLRSFSLSPFLRFFFISDMIPSLSRLSLGLVSLFVLGTEQKTPTDFFFLFVYFSLCNVPAPCSPPQSRSDLVENVEVPLVLVLAHDS